MSTMLPEQMMSVPAPPLPLAERVRAVIDEVRAIAEENGLTEQERLIVEDVTTKLQKLNTGREREEQALLGGGPATVALQRAYGSTGAA